MAKNQKWTVEEEQVLTDQIKRNANNLTKAFRKASSLINRSPGACAYHWYGVMLKNPNTAVCLVTVGYKTKSINRKLVADNTSDNTEKTTASWWKKFLAFLSK